jgi:hypothetical protein
MLQDMDSLEASCVLYGKVGKLKHLEHGQIGLVTVNKVGIVTLTYHITGLLVSDSCIVRRIF